MLNNDVREVVMSFHNGNEKIARAIEDLAVSAQNMAWSEDRVTPCKFSLEPCKVFKSVISQEDFLKIDRLMDRVYVHLHFAYEDNHCSKLSALYWFFHDETEFEWRFQH